MIKGHRRSKKVMEGHGKSRNFKEGHRWSFPITGLTLQVRKVMGGGGGVDDAVDKLLHLGESWIWRTENCTNFAKLNNCTNGTR